MSALERYKRLAFTVGVPTQDSMQMADAAIAELENRLKAVRAMLAEEQCDSVYDEGYRTGHQKGWLEAEDKYEPRIAELEASEAAATALMLDFRQQMEDARKWALTPCGEDWKQRAEKAEAENERLTELADLIGIREDKLLYENERLRSRPRGIGDGDITAALDERDALRAENERLRVCGTCAKYGIGYGSVAECDDGPPSISEDDPCHFTPSRWTPYWEDE